MSKLRATIICCVLVLVATVIMSFMYIFSNVTYSYVPKEYALASKIITNNVQVIKGIDTYRVDGPNINNNDINLELDLNPYETYQFSYDVSNKTGVDYELSKVLINCLNDENVNDYLTVDMRYEDGSVVTNKSIIPDKVKKIVTVTISYDKNVSGIKTFNLNFDMDYNVTNVR